MFAKYILIILLYFAFTKSFAQATDGLSLNVRLYPVQMLAYGTGFSEGETESSYQEARSVMISSPSGFQLNAGYDKYYETADHPKSNRERSDEYLLITHQKGVVEQRYAIGNEIENAINNLGAGGSDGPDSLILTLISQ